MARSKHFSNTGPRPRRRLRFNEDRQLNRKPNTDVGDDSSAPGTNRGGVSLRSRPNIALAFSNSLLNCYCGGIGFYSDGGVNPAQEAQIQAGYCSAERLGSFS
ncbi:hypothetical protein HPP92_023852 [Vanilla planifolia]|uniref:Uncharacterized protein n=1 Tax=Vanilla planifolia TaxID=51239 RepID=A0A835UB90_VANPL|nr:hypothetical protein HPP92_024220 [Vanilla planifolia]KAG0456064.1 hypothetical protein HPP92_023852 [Vanilla planifolia]